MSKVVCVAPGTCRTYFGECGFPTPSSVVSRLHHTDLGSFQGNAFQAAGNNVVVTLPTTATRKQREQLMEQLFEVKGAESVFFLSEPVAATYATGCERLRIVDIGHTHLTVSLVEDGALVKFYTSSSLGLASIRQDESHTAKPLSVEELERMTTGKKSIVSLVRRLPAGATSQKGATRILFVGGGASGPEAAQHFRDTFPNDEVMTFSQPAQTAFVGASLFGSVDQCHDLFVTRKDYDEVGRSVVHWRCPE